MDAIRNGRFTSSENHRLVGFGMREMTEEELAARPKKGKGSSTKLIADKNILSDVAKEYIEECNMERRLERALDREESARPTSWGKLVEVRAFDLLGLEYKLCSQETIQHPTIPYWVGSPDGQKFDEGGTVIDIKCPLTRKSFCQLVDCLYMGLKGTEAINLVRDKHKDGDKYYWQLVSNAILTNSKFAELIVYVPYKSELNAIRKLADDYPGDPNDVAWINWAGDESLPYLNDKGYYKNLNIIRWEVSQDDKDLLTEAVLKAGESLIEYKLETA